MRLLPARARDDRGFTLIELVVSMVIMTVIATITTAAVTQIYSAANKVDTTSYSRSQLTVAFRRLDTEMRYATWLGAASTTPVGGSYYVEYAMGATTCRELKFDTNAGVLSLYSWTLPSTTPANPVALASNVSLTGGVQPFFTQAIGTFPYATASTDSVGLGKAYSPQFAQLRVRFTALTGTTTAPFDTIYTAENTAANTATSNDCSKGRPTT
jgi:prepilin-type N-terminal cleavage/methylation domain-containing protein